MARSKSSKNWLNEHFDDPYVKKSREDGYRSRASYKLIELSKKDRLIKPGMFVLDLGAAPGGWSQVAAELVGEHGKVLASDILPMDPLAEVSFVQGDFTEDKVFESLLAEVDRPIDLVISDMAPNMSGNAAIDIPSANYLVELALDMAARTLTTGGGFVAKVFQGEGFDDIHLSLKQSYNRVMVRKPDSSRARSREVYLVALGFKG